MKLCKHYSLDECSEKNLIIEKLEELQLDSKIEYDFVESEIFKIKDTGLTVKDSKELISFFNEYDVIDYPDYENLYDEDDIDEEDEEDDDEEEY